MNLDHINSETGQIIPLSEHTVVPTAVKLERRKRRPPRESKEK